MRLFHGLFTVFLLAVLTPVGAATPEPAYILAVHPYLRHDDLIQRYEPLADYLAQRIYHPIQVRVGQSYQEHIDHVGRDQVDIAFMGPAPYVRMTQTYGHKPLLARLASHGRPLFSGKIIVRTDNRLVDLQALQGHTFAFGSLRSTMSYLLPRHLLHTAGIQLGDLAGHRFLGSHQDVALAVLSGDFSAGAVKEEVYQRYRSRGLRALATTGLISEHLFVTRKDLPDEVLTRLRIAMLNLHKTGTARQLLRLIKRTATALVPVADRDYDSLRAILRELDQITKP